MNALSKFIFAFCSIVLWIMAMAVGFGVGTISTQTINSLILLIAAFCFAIRAHQD